MTKLSSLCIIGKKDIMPINEEDFLKQVEYEIRVGELKKLVSLKKTAAIRNFEIARVKLNKAIENLKNVKSIQEQVSSISEEKKQRIMDKYLNEGVSLDKLAISYKIKKTLIMEIIEKHLPERKRIRSYSDSPIINSIKENTSLVMLGPYRGDLERILWRCENGHKFEASPKNVGRRGKRACPLCAFNETNRWNKNFHQFKNARFFGTEANLVEGATFELDTGKFKKQLNLRLKEESQRQLSELYEYWKGKGNFKFLNIETNNAQIFSSTVSFSKFILETALEHLNIDYENEKQIDLLALWISKKRIQIPEIKEKWIKLKNYKLEDWTLHSKELDDYIKSLNIFSKEELFNEAMTDWVGINKDIFEIIWPVAIKRSHLIPDEIKENTETDLDLKMRRLKDLYGKND
ncbi:Hypothetical protein P9215_16931 [Prochlorococcus marinus str. MIT 9215]|uniref:Uncharacterized protein n=1 Tax=Prochlorococcus marinus (strain MIT 9215) TaxID=93060 RepID=A8G6S5_PROM2|nr:hypothetical protein [Prochlorococcus marinus]ABV51306.1 Hypothetical protein P9215_16931 [Prochlorococcus marinus str. MIT 9215]